MECFMRPHSNTISKIGLLGLLLVLPGFVRADAAQYVGWGDQMRAQQKYDDAVKYYGAAVKADPRNEAAYRGLGYSYIGKRDMVQGIRYMEYALQLNPADNGLRQYLGQTYQGYGTQYYKRGDKTNALAWWDKAVKVDPSNTRLSAYVASIRGSNAAAPAQTAAAPAAEGESVGPTPGINPWIMGATVAALGAIMLFVF
jgi:tetratricopeptide (TPR) repeat protein